MVSIIRDLPWPPKIWKIKETVHKFQNARQGRTGRNVVKSSSPCMPIT